MRPDTILDHAAEEEAESTDNGERWARNLRQ
jgi:hypothetical protein